MTSCLPPVHAIGATYPPAATMPRPKSSLAASYASYVVRVHTRHGIKTLSFDVLAELFTFTAKKAAEDLGISSRTLIRVCRSLGIRRWPYLGFRSEKNVERIRQEAMENLRRKLEKEGDSLPTAVLHPNASSLRGASAKRLLQVKLPQTPLSMLPGQSWCSSPTLSSAATSIISDEDERMSEGDDSDWMVHAPMGAPVAAPFPSPHAAVAPLMTPPSVVHGFNLDVQRVSPSKVGGSYSTLHSSPLKRAWTPRPSASPVSPIPSLNLLVDASILTAFKQDQPPQQKSPAATYQPLQPYRHPRTMSMQDILRP